MDKEVVYGSEISVNFRSKSDADFSDSPPRDPKGSTSSNEASDSSSSGRDSSVSPPRESDLKHNYSSFRSKRKFNFPPPPLLDKQNSPSLLKHGYSEELPFSNKCTKSESTPMIYPTESTKEKMFQQSWNNGKVLPLSSSKCHDQSAFSPFQKGKDCGKAKYAQRNIGRVSPFLMQDYDKSGRNLPVTPLNDVTSRRNQLRTENSTNIYPFYSSQVYPAVCPSMGFADMHRISDTILYSSQWNGAALHNDASQLIQRDQIPCDNSSVELYVSNLDPTFEVNEMKKNFAVGVQRAHHGTSHINDNTA